MKIKNGSKFGDRTIEENKSEINPAFKPEMRCFKPEIEMLSRQKNVQASGLLVYSLFFDKLRWLSEAN